MSTVPPPRLWFPRGAESSTFSQWLSSFETTTLAQIENAALLDRTDTKYVIGAGRLQCVLAPLSEHYRVLDVVGRRAHHYSSLYFDTSSFALYMRHHAGSQVRYKIRSRRYVDSGLSFLEVKMKTNKGRTVKKRIHTSECVTGLTPERNDFVAAHTPFAPESLEPKLWNDYSRITLVSKRSEERLTLDTDIQFSAGDRTVRLPGVAIAEVKQAGFNRASEVVREMRRWNIRPTGISKYCIGVALLYPAVKHNNFKQKLRILSEAAGGNYHVSGSP